MRYSLAHALLALALFSAPDVAAQAPDSLSFQGMLTDTLGNQLDSSGVELTFTLYKGTSPVWTETQTVDVKNGIFNVLLGDVVDLGTLAFDEPMKLGIEFVGNGSEVNPHTPLAAVAYARALPGLFTFYRVAGQNEGFNVVGGHADNVVGASVVGVTIAGGGGIVSGSTSPNRVNGSFAAIGGGAGNTASGDNAVVPGGFGNSARGHSSFAAGFKARANHAGSFVWNDRSKTTDNDSLLSTAVNQFIVRAKNGVGINRAPANFGIHLKQGGVSNLFGIRTEYSADADYWETHIDVFDDYNFSFNGSIKGWIEDTDGSYVAITDPAAAFDVQLSLDVLSNVMQLNPKTYRTSKASPSEAGSFGFTMSEFETVFPELVSTKGELKGVKTAGLSVVAIKAVQELYELVQQQQAEIDRLREIVEATD